MWYRHRQNVKNYLINSADDQVGNSDEDALGWDKYYGHGRLNATAIRAASIWRDVKWRTD